MKNVALKKHGLSYVLIGPGGTKELGFSLWIEGLPQKIRQKKNTFSAYSRGVARFLDYVYEGASLRGSLTEGFLVELCESFEEFLLFGELATKELARTIAKTLPSPELKAPSLDNIFPAVNHFLEQSEKLQQKLQELAEHGIDIGCDLAANSLLPELSSRKLSQKERGQLLRKSWFAGCLSGGPKAIRTRALTREHKKPDEEYITALWQTEHAYKTKAFPYDRTVELIESMTSYRNKALFALMAATGCRKSEALQLQWSDIDIEKREVLLIDPDMRPDAYRTLSPIDREKLAWKGRQRPQTFMLANFGYLFFKYLTLYENNEYVNSANHDFVFQVLHHSGYGKPLFTAYPDSIIDPFKKTAKKVLGEDARFTPHSLRHMYGYYLKNWAKNPASNERGLEISQVRQWMGHKNVKVTERYALNDALKEKMLLAYVNSDHYDPGAPKTIQEMQLEHLQAQRQMLTNQIEALETKAQANTKELEGADA